MVISANDKVYEKIKKKGGGSVLKGLRAGKGGGRGCIGGGSVLLVFGLLIGIPDLIAGIAEGTVMDMIMGIVFIAPGLFAVIIGVVLRNKRNSSYMSFYQKETGFGEEEIRQVDRELASDNVQIIGYIKSGSRNERGIACIITENYFVTEWYYVRRLDDMIAAAYTTHAPSSSDAIFGLLLLSKSDNDVHFETYGAPADRKQELCMEVIEALKSRREIIPVQNFTLNGKQYDLSQNSRELVNDLRAMSR